MRSSLFAYSFALLRGFCLLLAAVRPCDGGRPAAGISSLMFLAYNIVAFGLQAPLGHLAISARIPAGLSGAPSWRQACWRHPRCGPRCCLRRWATPFSMWAAASTASRTAACGAAACSCPPALRRRAGHVGWQSGLSLALPLGMLLLSGVLVAASRPRKTPPAQFALDVSSRAPFAALILLASLSIVIRAYVGAVLPLPWKSASALMGLLPAAFAFAGKAAGGILADRLGARNVGVISLLASLPCLALGNAVPAAAMAGLALFNMTRPITLCALASRLQDSTGFAFGLSTLALLIGTVPTFFFRLPDGTAPYVIAALIALSALFVLLSTRNQEGCLSHKPSESIQYPAV